jgi:hypothetical protein
MIEPCFTSINATTHYKESNYRILPKKEGFKKNQFLSKECAYLTTNTKKENTLGRSIDQATVRFA